MDGKTAQRCQQLIITSKNAEHQATTPAPPIMEADPSEDRNAEAEALLHRYSCFKLSFLIKMALVQNMKAFGYNLPEQQVMREEELMEEARARAIEAWEQIRDRGFSYDVHGFEHLRSCTQHCD